MEVFPIAPVAVRGMSGLWVVPALVVLLVGGALGASIWGAMSSRFEVTPAGLHLRGDFYGRRIPMAALQTDRAERVNLDVRVDLRPRWKTMGTGLPGYKAGWFRLGNGEKALVYLTDRTRAVYLPTTEGYSVLVSPADPEAFLAALRRQPQ